MSKDHDKSSLVCKQCVILSGAVLEPACCEIQQNHNLFLSLEICLLQLLGIEICDCNSKSLL